MMVEVKVLNHNGQGSKIFSIFSSKSSGRYIMEIRLNKGLNLDMRCIKKSKIVENFTLDLNFEYIFDFSHSLIPFLLISLFVNLLSNF